MRFFLLALLSAALPALAQDLQQVYRDAKAYDAQYAAARSALEAGLEKLPQGRALLLPTVNATAGTTTNHLGLHPYGPNPVPEAGRTFYNRNYQLSLSQPLFRPQNWLQYNQAEQQVRQSEAVFGQASQDLIVRVAQAYFDVLAAQDTLALVRAQKAAISEQLAQAKRNFEVGTATITDTHEAQARYDLTAAQEIVAQNDVDTRNRALQQLTGKEYAALQPLRPDVKLSPPNPNNMQTWVDIAEKSSYPVQIQEAAAQIAELEAKRARAAHLPTLDLVATHGLTSQTGSSTVAVGSD